MDAKGWKEKGDELFKVGKFNDALISAYRQVQAAARLKPRHGFPEAL
jgi:hypothetical protein